MTRRVAYVVVAGLLLMALIPQVSIAAEPIVPESHRRSLDLLFINSDKPQRLELRVEVDGQPVSQVWEETFAKLLVFLDRNTDGVLDQTEAGRLPSAFAIRSILWGQFTTSGGEAPLFATLDANADGQVMVAEVANYYWSTGLGGVLIGIGKPPATDQLTAALIQRLDTNQSGKIDEGEWKTAAEILHKLDSNDDELIGPGELVAQTIYPGALGSILIRPRHVDSLPDPVADSLPFVMLPYQIDDRQWIKSLEFSRSAVNLKPFDSEVLGAIRTVPPCARWRVRLGAKMWDQVTLNVPTVTPLPNAAPAFVSGNVRFDLRQEDGKLQEQTTTARKRFAALFAEGDSNSDGVVDATELGTPKAVQLHQLAPIADRNGDRNLGKDEFVAWIDLQEQFAKGLVLLTVLDHGNGLFELFDADRDGSLSLRELQTAGTRAQAAGSMIGGALDRTRLPRHFRCTISHGHPLTMIGKPVRRGPDWFQAMDRNGDGDVSPREFSGTAEVLKKLDSDQDGFISAEEAEKAKS